MARDIETTEWLRNFLDQNDGLNIPLIYSLAIPHVVMCDPVERRKIKYPLRSIPVAAIWRKIENFGSQSSPTTVRNYLGASADFQECNLPLIGDQIGGLVGLGLLAFGPIGGIAHGVTMKERFSVPYWRRPREDGNNRSMQRRVYVRGLDLMLKPAEAKILLESSSQARAQFGCRDSHCCPRGVQDMIENPARHFLYQRMQEISELGQAPSSLRAQNFLEESMRPATDRALAAANINWSDNAIAKKTPDLCKRLDRLRIAFGKHAEDNPASSTAGIPLRRIERDDRR